MPDLKPRFIVRSSSRWAKLALERLPFNAVITSPYLTSPAAEAAIGRADPKTAVVLTTFDAATFAVGGSSLSTIRKLMGLGFTLRALDGLHAKLIVTEGTVLVGSQNLTAAGTRNREATARLSSPLEVAHARDVLDPWIAASRPITAPMVDHMEKLVGHLRKLASDLEASCTSADTKVREAEEQREHQRRKAAEKRRAAAERARLRRAKAREVASGLRRAVEAALVVDSVLLRLERLDSMSYGIASGDKYWTLLAPVGVDMTRWALPPEGRAPLAKRDRYLVVAPDTGRLGWLALQKTRLTGFGTGVSNKGEVMLDGVVLDVSIKTNQDLSTLATWNIEFELGSPGSPKEVAIRGVFSLNGFKTQHISVVREDRALRNRVRDHLRDASGDLVSQLCTVALEPFRYAKNGRMPVATEQFCEGLRKEVVLKLRLQAEQPFFSLE